MHPQLRVHMSCIGHPIFGDSLYAPTEIYHARKRLALHALAIRFKHPVSHLEISLTAPIEPELFSEGGQLLKKDRQRTVDDVPMATVADGL